MIFAPKRGPVFTRNRFQHLLIGALAVSIGAHWGYEGMAWGFGGVTVLAFAWEALTGVINKFLKLGWPHPYGDIVDFASFVAGAGASAAIVSVLP